MKLYTTVGCHLCDEAVAIVEQVIGKGNLQLVDIAYDDNLLEQWGDKIPVLLNDSDEKLLWPFSLLDVTQFIRR